MDDLFALPDIPQQQHASPPPAPSDALAKSAELIAGGPAALLAEALPADPSQSSTIPFGWAALGACVVAAIFANSLDKKK